MSQLSTQTKTASSRNFNLDLIRIIAFIFIPCLHFFLHTGFYSYKVTGLYMTLMFFARNLFLMCIPLFLLLTGFLQGNKNITPNAKYFLKITKFLVPYLIVALMCILTDTLVYRTEYSFEKVFRAFTEFKNYTWYVEMYLGLFLLIPFLNMIWANLKTKTQEHALLGIIITLTLLPSLLNSFDFGSARWYSASESNYWFLTIDWWKGIYPLAYYFTGAYLKKHFDEFRLKSWHWLVLFLASSAVFNIFYLIRNWGTEPSIYAWFYWDSITLFITGICLFMFVATIKFKRVPVFVSKPCSKLSDLTFGAYMTSAIADRVLYGILNAHVYTLKGRTLMFPLIIFGVLIMSFVLSFAADLIYKGLTKLCKKIFSS